MSESDDMASRRKPLGDRISHRALDRAAKYKRLAEESGWAELGDIQREAILIALADLVIAMCDLAAKPPNPQD